MKFNTLFLPTALLFSCSLLVAENNVIPSQQLQQDIPVDNSRSDEEMAQIALAQLATMIHSFMNLAKDPNNPSVVASTVGTLISSMATIVSEGLKARLIKPNATEQEILDYIQTFGKEMRTRLASIMKNNADELCALINE